MAEPTLGLLARLWLAYVVFFKVLLSGSFAARVAALRSGVTAALPPHAEPRSAARVEETGDEARALQREAKAAREAASAAEATARELTEQLAAAQAERRVGEREGALWLLALLQREGRLVDFLQQDITSFEDADVGGAARVIHEGCRAALKPHLELEAVRDEGEGVKVTVPAGYDAQSVKLTGAVSGGAPFSGVLRHQGWRARRFELPELGSSRDSQVIAPAEVEL